MKRFVVVAALFACVTTAVSMAVANEAPQSSSAKAGGKGFKVDFQNGEPINVRKFSFRNLVLKCDEQTVSLSVRGLRDIPVDDDAFDRQFAQTDPENTITISGTFNKKATKARGLISATGDFENSNGGGSFTNCAGQKEFVKTV